MGAETLHRRGVGDRRQAGLLHERRHAGMRRLDDLGDRVARALRHHQPAQPPAGHHPGLGKAVRHHHPVVRLGHVQQRRRGVAAVVDQARIHLVGDQPGAVLAAQRQDGRQLVVRRGPAGRVVRRVQDECARTLQQRVEPVEIQAEPPVRQRGQLQLDHLAPRAAARRCRRSARRGCAAPRARRRARSPPAPPTPRPCRRR